MQTSRLDTTPACGSCIAAERLPESPGLTYHDTDLTGDPELRSRLSAEDGGYQTVSIIFLGEESIGGYTDPRALHERGELPARAGRE